MSYVTMESYKLGRAIYVDVFFVPKKETTTKNNLVDKQSN